MKIYSDFESGAPLNQGNGSATVNPSSDFQKEDHLVNNSHIYDEDEAFRIKPQIPKELIRFVDELKTDILKQTQLNESMLITSILSYMAAIISGRMYIINGGGISLKPNLWFCVIAQSAGGKSTAMSKAREAILGNDNNGIIALSNSHFNSQKKTGGKRERKIKATTDSDENSYFPPVRFIIEFGSSSSFPGILKKMESAQYGGIISYGELSELFSQTKKDHTLKASLTDIYDGNPITKYLSGIDGNGRELYLPTPCLTINGVTNLNWILSQVQIDDLESGFLNRFGFIVLEKDDIPPLRAYEFNDTIDFTRYQNISENLLAQLGWRLDNGKLPTDAKSPIEVKLSTNAKEYYKLWFDELAQNAKLESPAVESFCIRQGNASLKYALILCVFDNVDHKRSLTTPISLGIMKKSIELAEYFIYQAKKTILKLQPEQKDTEEILALILKRMNEKKKTNVRDLKVNTNALKKVPSKTLHHLIAQLETDGKILSDENGKYFLNDNLASISP